MASRRLNLVAELNNSLVCFKCKEVAKDPWQHVHCGNLQCGECLERHGRDKPCPRQHEKPTVL